MGKLEPIVVTKATANWPTPFSLDLMSYQLIKHNGITVDDNNFLCLKPAFVINLEKKEKGKKKMMMKIDDDDSQHLFGAVYLFKKKKHIRFGSFLSSLTLLSIQYFSNSQRKEKYNSLINR